jgi:glutamate dehydrogenase/leucine dehydrogenase
MDDVTFAVLGTGGIGRRTLDVSRHKDGLTPVAACDRNGVAVDKDGLDVDELLDATERNIASGTDESADGDTPASSPASRANRRRRRSTT